MRQLDCFPILRDHKKATRLDHDISKIVHLQLEGFPVATLTVLLFPALPLFAQESSGPAQATPTDVMKQLEAQLSRG
jgi:hypothetical protein